VSQDSRLILGGFAIALCCSGAAQLPAPEKWAEAAQTISVASIDDMRRHNPRGGMAPDVFTHAGIEDAFLEKASTIWYWDGDGWLQLRGAK
jgi:hypothetical protein